MWLCREELLQGILWHKHTINWKLGHLLAWVREWVWTGGAWNWNPLGSRWTVSLVGFPVIWDLMEWMMAIQGMVLGSRAAWLPFVCHTAVTGSNGKMPSGCRLSDVVFCGKIGIPFPASIASTNSQLDAFCWTQGSNFSPTWECWVDQKGELGRRERPTHCPSL